MMYQVGDLVFVKLHNKTGKIVWVNPNKNDYEGEAVYLVVVGEGKGFHEGEGIIPTEKTEEIREKYGDYSCLFSSHKDLEYIPIEPD